MLNKEEIEKAKGITKNYIKDTPVAPYECLMNEERKAAIVLLEYIEQLEKTISRKMSNNKRLSKKYLKERYQKKQLESDKQKLIEKLEGDKMEQFDDYVIYLLESYLEILKKE